MRNPEPETPMTSFHWSVLASLALAEAAKCSPDESRHAEWLAIAAKCSHREHALHEGRVVP